jgi:cytochrome c553
MKHPNQIKSIVLTFILAGLPLWGWSAEATYSTTLLPATLHIRSLAASCAACHGENGNSVGITPSLAGLNVSYFTTQMLAFKNGSLPATVMHRHAKGIQEDEIQALAKYFSQQKRVTAIPAPTQEYRAHHAD